MIAALRLYNGRITVTARALGTGYQKLKKFINANPEVEEVLALIKEENLEITKEILLSLAGQEDFRAIKLYLQKYGQSRGYGL